MKVGCKKIYLREKWHRWNEKERLEEELEKEGKDRKVNSSEKRRDKGGRYSKDVLLEFCRNDEMQGDVKILRRI